MKKKKLKLTSFSKHEIKDSRMNNIYAGSDVCGNTCDCTCTCDPGNSQQLNTNVNSVSTNNRDSSFVNDALEIAIDVVIIGML